MNVTKAITGYWEVVAELFDLADDIKGSVPCGARPLDYAMMILPRLRDRGDECTLSTWNKYARDGHIRFTLEVDGSLTKMGYNEWGYNVKMVPTYQSAPQPTVNPDKRNNPNITWDITKLANTTLNTIIIDTLPHTDDALAVYARYMIKGTLNPN